MSNLSPVQQKMLAAAAKKAELDLRNKEAAREQLLRMQIFLTRMSPK
jgi:hypothetical protein